MSNWHKDKFLSDWDRTYVSTNLKEGAKPYDAEVIKDLHSELGKDVLLHGLTSEILSIAAISLGRADLVGKWFDDVTKDFTPEESRKLFIRIRESIMCLYPFLGAPACMPACYGMIGVVEHKGETYGDTTRLRKGHMDSEDIERGMELRAAIYKSAGNRGIFEKMDKYFADLYNASTAFTWGYIISRANDEIFQMQESHLLILTGICGLGAKRQIGSHIKATIGIGNNVESVKKLLSVVQKFADWAERPVSLPDVDALAKQVEASAQTSSVR